MENEFNNLIKTFMEFGILKKAPRTGWTWRNVPDCESIADHCYRVNLISMVLCDFLNSSKKIYPDIPVISSEKVLRMAALHEIAECRVGDIPFPALKYIGGDVKTAAEKNAVKDMLGELSVKTGVDYIKLWNEFEDAGSIEGRLVKSADKFEMLLQAYEYERAGIKTLDDFWENAKTFEQIAFLPPLRELLDCLIKLRGRL
ncbi:MAG: HD domain-containing protein [Candidatus Wallbacteria bacterium]